MKPRSALRVIITAVLVCTSYSAVAESVTRLELEKYEGQVVVLDFWASWCVPCRRSFPWLSAMHVMDLRQGALATSGDAQRFLLREGVRYSHILDAGSGWPIPNAPASVTVAANTCTQAGMTSTLAMLEGERAEEFLDQEGVLFWCRR